MQGTLHFTQRWKKKKQRLSAMKVWSLSSTVKRMGHDMHVKGDHARVAWTEQDANDRRIAARLAELRETEEDMAEYLQRAREAT